MHAAEDGVFRAFCARIGVDNIREYEERTLRVAEETGAARVRFDTQLARLRNQCVHSSCQTAHVQLLIHVCE